MNRYETVLVVFLIGVFGLLPPLGYLLYQNHAASASGLQAKPEIHPAHPGTPEVNAKAADGGMDFRPSEPIKQHAVVLTAFVVKPLYTILAFFVAVLLWKRDELELKSLKWAMLFFFVGENFCAANYLLTANHDAHLLEYFHGLGMVLSFGFAAFAVIEWIDRYALHYSNPGRKCSLSGFCRQCVKFESVACGLQSLFVFFGFAGALVALMPLAAALQPVSYHTEIWGTLYNYNHPVVYQLAEVRYYPVLAAAMFLSGALTLLLKRDNPLHSAKIFFAAAVGAFGFSLFRFIVFQGFRDDLVWMDFWEEMTEFIYVTLVVLMLWYFRRALFERRAQARSASVPSPPSI